MTEEPRPKPTARNRRIAGGDPEKRGRILLGARSVFNARGFDAASMSEIATAAGVSKGTLYVYFEDKEHLFVALIEQERESQKQTMYAALDESADLVQALHTFGVRLARLLTSPFALSAHRIVLGVAERMPDVGRDFYDRGPLQGARRLASFIDTHREKGALALDDAALAAAQFLDLCQATLLRPRLFNAQREAPSDAEIDTVVREAVAMFLARYATGR